MSDKMREEFEDWFYEELTPTGRVYHATWLAWQASRASLVVELPVVVDIYDEHFGDHYEYFDVDGIKESLDAAGVKYEQR